MIDSVRLPCAIGPPNGLSFFARSMSTWIHWWSPDTSANGLIMPWVTSRQSLGPICWPTISFRPSIPSTVMGAMPGGYRQRPGSVDRAKARAEDAHPGDLAVALLEVGLLLDREEAFWIADSEAVADALAVGECVRLDAQELLDLVGILEPLAEDALDHVVGVAGLPVAARGEAAEVDLWVEEVADGGEVLLCERVGECFAVGGGHGADDNCSNEGRIPSAAIHLSHLCGGNYGSHDFEGAVDPAAVHVEVGDCPEARCIQPGHLHAGATELVARLGRVGHLEHHDVGVHLRGVDRHAVDLCQPFRQQARVLVVLRQPLHVVVEGVEAGCGHNAGLAHRASPHLLVAPGLVDQVARSDEHRADRRA